MSLDLFRLTATLGLDASEYDKGVKDARATMGSLAEGISAKTVAMGNLIARGVEKAANAAVNLGKSAVTAAADVVAEQAQFKATFGELQGEAEKAFGNISKATGVFGTRLKNVGTKAFSQFKGAGMDGVDALGAMEKYTNIAADAAAYYDITLEEADEKLRSFLRGNTEAGDAIGLFTSESQRNTYAMDAYGKKWANLTEEQKQMLMLNVAEDIYEQSGAIGQASREADSWTNVIGNLKEAWRQALAKFGEPIVATITPIVQSVTEWLSNPEVQTKIEQFSLGLSDVINAVVRLDFPTWEEVETWSAEKIEAIIAGIESLANWTLGKFDLPDVETIKNQIVEWWTGQGDNAYERIKSVLSWTLGEFIAPNTESFVAKVSEWWNGEEGGKSAFQSALDWTIGELYLPAWIDLVDGIMKWWENDIRPMIKRIAEWDVGEVNWPSVDEMYASASTWWAGVWESIKGIFKINIQGDYYGPTGSPELQQQGIDIMTSASMRVPGKAVGIDYVPYNDMPARLHEGEAVLTKAEATAWRNGGDAQIDYNAMGAAVGQGVREALQGIGLYTDDGTRIADLVTERVSRNIAQGAKRWRFNPA